MGLASAATTLKFPELFAAAVPICGGGDPEQAARIKDLPLRVFHGAKDEAVPLVRSQEMVDALKAAGAQDITLKVYPNLAHDSWTPTYADPCCTSGCSRSGGSERGRRATRRRLGD